MITDVVYWDSSAILSVLFRDMHSEIALTRIRRPDIHIVSSLGWTEVHAVMARHLREGAPEAIVSRAVTTLENGWRYLRSGPSRAHVRELARRWPLRDADLWHLGTARTIAEEMPVALLSFDAALAAAATGEGLAP